MFQAMLSDNAGNEAPSTGLPTTNGMFQRPNGLPLLVERVTCPPLVPYAYQQQRQQLPVTPNNQSDNQSEETTADSDVDSDDGSETSGVSDGQEQPATYSNQQPSQCLMMQNLAQRQQQQSLIDMTMRAQYQQQQYNAYQQQLMVAPAVQQSAQFGYQQQPPQMPLQRPVPQPPVQPLAQQRPQPQKEMVNAQPTPSGVVPPPRSRAAYNRYQREFLNAVFERVHYPSRPQREAISRCLGGVVSQNQIKVWFQNARRRAVLRGVKFPPGRVNPATNEQQSASTPIPPQQNSGPGSVMVEGYFATIRNFVAQIVELGDAGQSQQQISDNRNRLMSNKPQKRSRPSDSDDDNDDEASESPTNLAQQEKRPLIAHSTPPRLALQVVQPVSASSLAASCISPDTSAESGIGQSFHSTVASADRQPSESTEEERPSSADSSSGSSVDPSGLPGPSGSTSSLSTYTSPCYNPIPIAGSTPNFASSAPNFGGLFDQQLALANAMRAHQQSYYAQMMMQPAINHSPVLPVPQRVHTSNASTNQDTFAQQRSTCAYNAQSPLTQFNPQTVGQSVFSQNFYTTYSSANVYPTPSGQTAYAPYGQNCSGSYNPFSVPQPITPQMQNYNPQMQFAAQSFAASLAAHLTGSSSSLSNQQQPQQQQSDSSAQ